MGGTPATSHRSRRLHRRGNCRVKKDGRGRDDPDPLHGRGLRPGPLRAPTGPAPGTERGARHDVPSRRRTALRALAAADAARPADGRRALRGPGPRSAGPTLPRPVRRRPRGGAGVRPGHRARGGPCRDRAGLRRAADAGPALGPWPAPGRRRRLAAAQPGPGCRLRGRPASRLATDPAGPGLPLPPSPAGGADEALAAVLGRTRLDILLVLAEEHTTGALARRLCVSNATVSTHTAALRGAGLITTQRAGRAVLHRRTPLGTLLVQRGRPAGPPPV
ncbi:ArsR/SmtB family transcription factor [Streptomyces noursei]|uniref:ArsR/SmtB family transcription factor n=1 Tax=Streptomyces noursei TaxID=1971 RepID=UPI0033EDD218